jgi:hypothetical protein
MDEPMTHERCSELLRGYVRGELAGDVADEVRAHLAGCADCRAEEAAAAALVEAPEVMDDVERARLHRALAQELFASAANADVAAAGAAEPPWRRWIVPALGSAAAVLVVVLVLASGGISITGGEDADQGGSAPAGIDRLEEGADRAEDAGAGGGSEAFGTTEEEEMELEDAEPDAARAVAAGPRPEFDADAGTLTVPELSATGRSSDLFRSFAARYTLADVPALDDEFLKVLARAAGTAGSDVRKCAATLPQDGTLLPAYGALGEYEGEDALVVGFVTSDAASAALDRYLMWIWPRDSCRQPIETLFEEIDE